MIPRSHVPYLSAVYRGGSGDGVRKNDFSLEMAYFGEF